MLLMPHGTSEARLTASHGCGTVPESGFGDMRMIRNDTSRRCHRPRSYANRPNQSKSVQISPNQSKSVQISPNQSKSVQISPNQSKSVQISPNQSKSRDVERLTNSSGNRAPTTTAPPALSAWRPEDIHPQRTTLPRGTQPPRVRASNGRRSRPQTPPVHTSMRSHACRQSHTDGSSRVRAPPGVRGARQRRHGIKD